MKPNSIQGKLAGLSIMVVEDGADNQRIFRHFLRIAGADFVIVADGRSALERALHDEAIDLVLMDIQIPEMDGYEVTERLRQSGFTRPIIAVTAHTISLERARGREVGITDYIAKPIQIDGLIQTILHYTRGSAGETQQELATHDSARHKQSADVAATHELSTRAGHSASLQATLQETVDSARPLLSKYHDKALYRPIIIDFISAFQLRLETMQAAVQAMDWEQLSVTMHQIKGAAATYGFPELSEVAGQMELSAKDAKRDAHAVQLIHLQAERLRLMGARMRLGLDELENRSL